MSGRRRWPAAAVLVAVLAVAPPAPAQAEPSPRPAPSGAPSSPGHSHEHSHDAPAPPPAEEPSNRALVLGGFGLVNAAVLGGAVLLRRRDRRRGASHGTRQSRAGR
jgi:hypothetical protein